MFLNRKYILHSESEDDINQLHFSNAQILGLVTIALVILGSFLLVGADYISKTLYDKRLKEFKANYNSVAGNVDAIQNRLRELDQQILDIEENISTVITKVNANETVTWEIGTSDDGSKFAINSSGEMARS